jgi:hypothetical protein
LSYRLFVQDPSAAPGHRQTLSPTTTPCNQDWLPTRLCIGSLLFLQIQVYRSVLSFCQIGFGKGNQQQSCQKKGGDIY